MPGLYDRYRRWENRHRNLVLGLIFVAGALFLFLLGRPFEGAAALALFPVVLAIRRAVDEGDRPEQEKETMMNEWIKGRFAILLVGVVIAVIILVSRLL